MSARRLFLVPEDLLVEFSMHGLVCTKYRPGGGVVHLELSYINKMIERHGEERLKKLTKLHLLHLKWFPSIDLDECFLERRLKMS